MDNEISYFLSTYQDMLHIINNDVTCQLNIQVKYIVQIYHFKQNVKHDDTCDIHDFQLYIK